MDSPMDSIEKQKFEIAAEQSQDRIRQFFGSFTKQKRYLLFALVVLAIPVFYAAKFTAAQIILNRFYKTQIIAHRAAVTPQDVVIIETKALTIVGKSYSAYALIKNPNNDLVTKELKYTFHFYDAKGVELGNATDKTYLLGGEEKYLILPNIKLDQQPQKVSVQISQPVWQYRSDVPSVVVSTGIPQFADSTSPIGFEVNGSIQNQSISTIGEVKIDGIVFDKLGQVIAVIQRTEDSVQPKETRPYQLFWPLPIADQVSNVRIIAETNVLDSNNIR